MPTKAAKVGFVGDVETGVEDAEEDEGKGHCVNLKWGDLGKVGYEDGSGKARESFKGIELGEMGAAMPSGEGFVKGTWVLDIVSFGDA